MTRNSCNESLAPLRERASRPRSPQGKPPGAVRLGNSSSVQIPSNSNPAPEQGRQPLPPGKMPSILLNNWVLRNAARALDGRGSRLIMPQIPQMVLAGLGGSSSCALKGWGHGTGGRYGNGGREGAAQKHCTCYYFSKFPLFATCAHSASNCTTDAAVSVCGAHVPCPRGESDALPLSYLCVFPDGELLTLGLLGCID